MEAVLDKTTLDKEKIAAIRAIRPGFNKSLYSMFYRRMKYGIAPDREVKRYLSKLYPGQPIPGEPEKKITKRKNTELISCRSTKKHKAEFLRAIKDDGFPDMQTGLSSVIDTYLLVGKQRDELLSTFKSDGFHDIPSGIKWLIEMYLIRRKANVENSEG